MLENSRFNPAPGVKDFWTEFRKPNPWRWPILVVSALPFALLLYYLSGETHYKAPERPRIDYITTFDPSRSDEEIIASNLANQEVKELREARDAALAERKRDLYKALGSVAGMDVAEAEQRGEEARKAREAAERARLDELLGRTEPVSDDAPTDQAFGEGASR